MDSDPRYIVDLIGDVVSDMRDTSSILSFTDNADGTYTVYISDSKDLSDGNYLTISGTTNFNGCYKTSNLVEDVSFDISKTSGYATDTGTWTADAPYYLYGHLLDVVKNLGVISLEKKKYPLIILDMDFEEDKGEAEIYSVADVNIYICNITDPNWSMDTRYTNNFKAILRPLADSLITKIMASNDFDYEEFNKVAHSRTDKPVWGVTGTGRNTANKLHQPTDCIHMEIELKVREKYDECIN